jgi:hypothetical protein
MMTIVPSRSTRNLVARAVGDVDAVDDVDGDAAGLGEAHPDGCPPLDGAGDPQGRLPALQLAPRTTITRVVVAVVADLTGEVVDDTVGAEGALAAVGAAVVAAIADLAGVDDAVAAPSRRAVGPACGTRRIAVGSAVVTGLITSDDAVAARGGDTGARDADAGVAAGVAIGLGLTIAPDQIHARVSTSTQRLAKQARGSGQSAPTPQVSEVVAGTTPSKQALKTTAMPAIQHRIGS